MKALKPSAREKKRYLLIKGSEIKKNLEKSILEFIGVLGMSKLGLSWIKSGKTSAIACVNREAVNKVRASLALCSNKLIVERVSGTLKGLKKSRKK